MDDLADSVQVVQSHQALLGHLSDDWKRSAFVVVSFDHFQQVATQDFKYCHKVLSMRTVVEETIQKLDTVAVVSSDI